MRFENEHEEYKLRATDELYKEIVAFANTDGGVIYVGIDDEGEAIGLEKPDEEFTRITNGIRDAILPDVTMFVRCVMQENRVVRIEVSEGSNKPYYLRSKGIKPGGVYLRQGASSAPASPEAIRRMIKESDGDNYEELRSLNQDLTFKAAAEAFQKYGVPFGEEKFTALGMKRPGSTLFTNLALLLSDQCLHSVKVAVFGDETKTVFRDQKEFGGSLFTQMEDTFHYLMLCNRTAADFRGLERVERTDYPEEALREALLNALIHRDYSFSGSIIINVNDREMEFISLGGLLPGLSPEDIRAGISQPRNKNLASVFHRLRLIEAYGTGIRRIFALYSECPEQPRIEVTANTFKMILPNQNAIQKKSEEEERIAAGITPQMRTVLELIEKRGEVTEQEIQEQLKLKKTRVYTLTKVMRQMGLIEVRGRGKEKRYLFGPIKLALAECGINI